MDTRTWMRYWRRAVWVTGLLRFVPFVRMVGLNGSMVTGTFRPESDIDLYIVTKDGHIFLARFLATALIQLTGLRIKPGKEAGMICPNRFAVESFVDITPHDDYHARVFHNLIPLFADGFSYVNFRQANMWMQNLDQELPGHRPVLAHGVFSFTIQKLGEIILGFHFLEQLTERWQRKRIADDPRAHAPGSKVIISERELRFHIPKQLHG